MPNRLTVVAMMLFGSLVIGCNGVQPFPRSETDTQLFGPVSMRLHPIFTQVKDWTGDGKPDGIEALVELQDQFGDPTKASGRVIFELFDYRPFSAERRGERVCNPWIGYLETLDEQRDRWNRTSRTYFFQLESPQIIPTKSYVLTAEFQLAAGGRFFDQIVLEGQKPEETSGANAFPPTTGPTTFPGIEPFPATTEPTTQPGARTPQP
jgi:hypothetical protein